MKKKKIILRYQKDYNKIGDNKKMDYIYIVDMISNEDRKKYIPEDIILLLDKRKFTEEEEYKIVISGNNYEYLIDQDIISFSKKYPEILLMDTKQNNKEVIENITYFEKFCCKLDKNSKYFNDFFVFFKNSIYWQEMLGKKGILDTLFELNSWEDIKKQLTPTEIEELKKNSSGEYFRKYLKTFKNKENYSALKYKKYAEVREELFFSNEILKVEQAISYIIYHFVKKNVLNRFVSYDFFENIYEVEKNIRDKKNIQLNTDFEKNLKYALLLSKILNPLYIKNNKIKESTFIYLKEYIKNNDIGLLNEILEDKKPFLENHKKYQKEIIDFIHITHVRNQKNKIYEQISINEDLNIKKGVKRL